MKELVLGNKEESCLPEIKGFKKQKMRLEEKVGVALLLNTKLVHFYFIQEQWRLTDVE